LIGKPVGPAVVRGESHAVSLLDFNRGDLLEDHQFTVLVSILPSFFMPFGRKKRPLARSLSCMSVLSVSVEVVEDVKIQLYIIA